MTPTPAEAATVAEWSALDLARLRDEQADEERIATAALRLRFWQRMAQRRLERAA